MYVSHSCGDGESDNKPIPMVLPQSEMVHLKQQHDSPPPSQPTPNTKHQTSNQTNATLNPSPTKHHTQPTTPSSEIWIFPHQKATESLPTLVTSYAKEAKSAIAAACNASNAQQCKPTSPGSLQLQQLETCLKSSGTREAGRLRGIEFGDQNQCAQKTELLSPPLPARRRR